MHESKIIFVMLDIFLYLCLCWEDYMHLVNALLDITYGELLTCWFVVLNIIATWCKYNLSMVLMNFTWKIKHASILWIHPRAFDNWRLRGIIDVFVAYWCLGGIFDVFMAYQWLLYHVALDRFIVKIFFCGEFDWLIVFWNLICYLA
jgi:hypothetical protein